MSTNKYSLNKQRKVLIIGGSGFVGTNIITKFTEYKVGEILNLDKKNASLGIKTKYLELQEPIFSEVHRFNPDNIIYLASLSENSCDDIKKARSINVDGLSSLLQELVEYTGLKSFIYLSDYGLYKDNVPFIESSNVLPSNNYLQTKLEAEQLLFKHQQEYGLPVLVLRVSSLYGPFFNLNYYNFLTNTLLQAVKNHTIEVSNNNIYDYLYVSDLVSSIIASFETDYTGVLNIGSGIGYSNIDIAKYIADQLKIEIKIKNNITDNVYINNITFAKNILGWQPNVNIEKGIKETIKHIS